MSDESGDVRARRADAEAVSLEGDPAPAVRILAVLVLYRCSLLESKTWQSLMSQVEAESQSDTGFRLLICINGASTDGPGAADEPAFPQSMPAWVRIVSVSKNAGLAWAYDYALALAGREGAGWLLTLDQDTELPADFLIRMQAKAGELDGRRGIGAIVPRLTSEAGKPLSPVIAGLQEQAVSIQVPGVVDGDVRAYNSGALMRVAALQAIGGYDRRFWLDYLDHAIFRALHAGGYEVWIESSLVLRHQLSLDAGRETMGEERFRNFAMAEAAFQDLHAGRMTRGLYLLRLMLRAVNQKRRGDPAHFFRTTVGLIGERLLLSRQERTHRWEASLAGVLAVPDVTMHLDHDAQDKEA